LFATHFGKPIGTIEREFEAWFTTELAAKIRGWAPSEDDAEDPRTAMWRAAGAMVEKDDHAGAIRTLEALIGKQGDGFLPRMALAQLVMGGKSPAAAKRHLEAAQKFATESIEPYVKLAELARKTGDVGEEKRVLRAALAIDADSLDPAARFLMLALVTEDRDGTELGTARVAALAPLHPIALGARAIALAKSGNTADATAHLARADEALRKSEGRGPPDTLVVVALAHIALGDRAGADVLALSLKGADLPAEAKKKLGL